MYPFVKRIIDIVVSLSVIIIFLPLFLVTALIIYLHDLHNPIFYHKRVGKNASIFYCYKFRSLPVNTPNVESNALDKIKFTPLGKFIRRSNLDELPQLYNILKGEMSLIGPRPPIPSQTNLIRLRSENGVIRLIPGLTGWAQVNSYSNMPDYEKVSLDEYYLNHISLALDINIVIRTLTYLTKKPPVY